MSPDREGGEGRLHPCDGDLLVTHGLTQQSVLQISPLPARVQLARSIREQRAPLEHRELVLELLELLQCLPLLVLDKVDNIRNELEHKRLHIGELQSEPCGCHRPTAAAS